MIKRHRKPPNEGGKKLEATQDLSHLNQGGVTAVRLGGELTKRAPEPIPPIQRHKYPPDSRASLQRQILKLTHQNT